jgi:hypothetical protein
VQAAIVAILLAVGATARADVEGATRLTMFREPGTTGNVQVIHPQADVGASLGGGTGLRAGYEVDLVSGATPVTFGPSEGPDAVSGATGFSDQRQAARGALSVETATMQIDAGYSYGWERDYRSHTVAVAGRGDFLERNFTLGLGYTLNLDSVCDQNNDAAAGPLDLQPLPSSDGCFVPDHQSTVSRRLVVHSFEPALAWSATPRLLLQFGVTIQTADGFQSNPYRRVQLGAERRAPQEHIPRLRQRFALFGRAHQAFPDWRASVTAMARVYRDTWALQAATAELGINKYLGPAILIGLRGRYHAQSGAAFYRTGAELRVLGPRGRYWTGDRELSPFSTALGGVKLSYIKRRERQSAALIEELELGVRFDFLFYDLPAGAPNADRTSAMVTQAGLSLRF